MIKTGKNNQATMNLLFVVDAPESIRHHFPHVMQGPLVPEAYLLAWVRWKASLMLASGSLKSWYQEVTFLYGKATWEKSRWRPVWYYTAVKIGCDSYGELVAEIKITTTDITGRHQITYEETLNSEVGGWKRLERKR